MANKKGGESKTEQRKGESTKVKKTYSCQICGKKFDDPVDTMAHLIDHGSSALDSVSQMIKNQKEGRVEKANNDAHSMRSEDEEEPF